MDEVLQKAIGEAAGTVLTLLTTVVIPYGLLLLRTWVKSKAALIEDRNLREGIEFAFDRLDKTAETVVREIEQVLKQRLDGKVAKPEQLLGAAIDRIYKRLPAPALRIMEENYSKDRLHYIVRGKVESKVKEAQRRTACGRDG